jgi:hypothetical protein
MNAFLLTCPECKLKNLHFIYGNSIYCSSCHHHRTLPLRLELDLEEKEKDSGEDYKGTA